MKLAMVGFELLAMAAMLCLLAASPACRAARVLIYAWNPLAVWAFAGNGHVDARGVGFVALALLARCAAARRLAGVALAAAVLMKFLPVASRPAFSRAAGDLADAARLRGDDRRLLRAVHRGRRGVCSDSSAGYVAEEGLEQGTGICCWPARRLTPLPRHGREDFGCLARRSAVGARRVVIFIRDAAPSQRLNRGGASPRDAAILAAAAMLALTPHYPWYFAWLALPACLCPARA